MRECAIYYVSSVSFFDGIVFGVGAFLGISASAGVFWLVSKA